MAMIGHKSYCNFTRPQPTLRKLNSSTYIKRWNHLSNFRTNVAKSNPVYKLNYNSNSRCFSTTKGSGLDVLRKTLTPEQDKFVEEEISTLKNLKDVLETMGATKEDIHLIQKSLAQLEDLFLLVIVGEFNSGKSSFLNALLGRQFLKEGVTPTTSKVGLLKWGDKHNIIPESSDKETITIPVEWLKEITLVDTPGTNAVVKGHQEITEHFVPRSDMVLFVTSVDRAFSQSERIFLENIKQWKKKVVVILSKVDILENEEQLNDVKQFVNSNFKELLGIEPIIFPVASKLALKAKTNDKKLESSEIWKKSRFGELESYISKSLTREERAKLKLENPLGIGEHLLTKYGSLLRQRENLLQNDIKTLDNINSQVDEYKKDMEREFTFQQDRVDNILLKMGKRGEDYLDDTLHIGRIFDLMKSDKLKLEFENTVVADTSRDIERQVSDIIDWMLSKNSRLWKDVMEYVQRGNIGPDGGVMGRVNTTFDYDRAGLIKTIGNSASEVVASYDRKKESEKLTNELKSALVTTAVVEVGAIGFGALFATSLLDFTGLLSAGVIAAGGLAIIPYKRSTMKKAYTKKIHDLRDQLKGSLSVHFSKELDESVRKIQDSIEPFTRFVKTEKERISILDGKVTNLQGKMVSLRQGIHSIFSSGSK